jgi:hypothetical protein
MPVIKKENVAKNGWWNLIRYSTEKGFNELN